MIEEDYDEPEDYKISQSSPEDKHIFGDGCEIGDFSSPLKAEQETIVEVSSPEHGLVSFQHSISKNSKRKRRIDPKGSHNLRKKPSLTLKITKKEKYTAFNEEVNNQDNSEIFHIEDNSPEESKLDLSGDIFAYQNSISDVSSPELDFSVHLNLKEEGKIDPKRSPNPTKGPRFPLTVLKKTSPQSEEIIDDDDSTSVQKEDNFAVIPYNYNIDTSDISIPKGKDLKENGDSQFISGCTQASNKSGKNAHVSLNSSACAITKAPKRGSLLEKASLVDSSMKKESVLYSHELNFGLRTSRGTFVSDKLIVKAIHSEETYNLLECVPLIFTSEFSKGNTKETIFIKTSKLGNNLKENSCIVVHFPVMIMYDTFLKCHIVFANDRIQLTSKKPSQQYFFFRELSVCITKQTKLFHHLKSRGSKSILDIILGHFLVNDLALQLEVLHFYRARQNGADYIKLLTIDTENQFCIIQLNLNDEVIHSQNIQTRAIYSFSGFSLTSCLDMTRKIRFVAEYYSSERIENEYIFIMEPVNPSWSISFLKTSDIKRCSMLSTWSSTIQQEFDEAMRFKLAISEVYCNYKNEVRVKEKSTNKVIPLVIEAGINDIFFPMAPFLLDGLRLLAGEVTYDSFSRVEVLES